MNKLYLKAHLQKAANGKIEFVASDETVDRSGESVPADSWDLGNFLKSPRLLVDHDYKVESIVGVAEDTRIDGKALKFSPKFHNITERAITVAKMVEEGVLDTVSVGFMRNQDAKGNVKNELMEISFVAVPANPNARMLSAKSAEEIEAFVKTAEPEEGAAADEAKEEDETAKAAEDPKEGDPCEMPDGTEGVMVMGEDGKLACQLKPEGKEKGMTEDVIDASSEMREVKWKYTDQIYAAFDKFCRAYYSDAVKPEDIKTLGAEFAAKIVEVSNMTPDELPGTPMWAGIESMAKAMVVFATNTAAKAGRELSSKNRDIISAQIDSLESVIAALKELHQSTQPKGDEDAEKSAAKKERSNPATPTLDAVKLLNGLKKQSDARKVLRMINTATSEALREYNAGKK